MRMNAQISRAVLDAILCDARLKPGLEQCGLLLGQGTHIQHFRPCVNVHPNPAVNFEIDPKTLITAHIDARTGGPQILGYYHNHPNGLDEPSATDAELNRQDDALWMIITADRHSLWRTVPGGPHLRRFTPVTLAVVP